jgi:thiamine-phosphate pyrophosphorylase
MASTDTRPFIVQLTDDDTLEIGVSIERVLRAASKSKLEAALILRDKQVTKPIRRAYAMAARQATDARATFLVAGDLALAAEVSANGLHLASDRAADPNAHREAKQKLGLGSITSAAAHSPREALAAAQAGANWVLLSPIHESPGKGAPLGVGALTEARRLLDEGGMAHVKLVALGGVNASNAGSCLGAGADGLATIRADLSELKLG